MSMTAQEAIATRTEDALKDFLASVGRMPSDKLNWRPLNHGRSALDQLQECATAPLFYLSVIQSTPFTSQKDIRKTWDRDECNKRANAATLELTQAIRALPDESLTLKLDVPNNGQMTLLEVLWMHLWNLTYHLGAVNYIQTLYGDQTMD